MGDDGTDAQGRSYDVFCFSLYVYLSLCWEVSCCLRANFRTILEQVEIARTQGGASETTTDPPPR